MIEYQIKRHITAIKWVIGVLVALFIFFGGLLLSLIVKDPLVGLKPSLFVGMAFLYPLFWPHLALVMILTTQVEIVEIWGSYGVTNYLQWCFGVIIKMASQFGKAAIAGYSYWLVIAIITAEHHCK
jgi:hypothetical protein